MMTEFASDTVVISTEVDGIETSLVDCKVVTGIKFNCVVAGSIAIDCMVTRSVAGSVVTESVVG